MVDPEIDREGLFRSDEDRVQGSPRERLSFVFEVRFRASGVSLVAGREHTAVPGLYRNGS